MEDKEYNGWKNRQTWNVMLWLENDEFLYDLAVKFMQTYKGKSPYAHFIRSIGYENECTPDNIKWLSTRLDYKELNEAMVELKGDN